MPDNVTPISEALKSATPAPDFSGRDGGDLFHILPPDAPMTVLGKERLTIWLLDHHYQLQGMKPRDLGKGELQMICGGDAWLIEHFPQLTKGQWEMVKEGRGTAAELATTFDQAKAQTQIIRAASTAGIFSPKNSMFGRGAHRHPIDDSLVLHLGDRVMLVRDHDDKGRRCPIEIVERRPGRIDNKLYPAFEALSPPAADPSTPAEAEALLSLFKKWYFFEPDIAPLLLLGWVGHALTCGAAPWRSHVWLTGETAAGKSTLQKVIRATLGDWGLYTEDATEPSIRQTLNNDTLPVMIDEAEADDRAERQRAMINLARKSSSGAKMHRGASDPAHATEFTAQSAFLFSSILHSPLDPQDRNRFAILAMRQIPNDAQEPILDLRRWTEAGRRMHRRMIEQWPRYERTLTDYKDEIRAQGFQGRWRDTFGALLACADLLLHDRPPSAESIANEGYGRQVDWVRKCLPMMTRGSTEAEDTTTRCITRLTSTLLPASSGQHQETVGRWIRRAMDYDTDSQSFNHAAREKLKSHGLRVVNLHKTASGAWGAKEATFADPVYVLVASKTNASLARLFEGSKWFDGGWSQALALAQWTGSSGNMPPRVAKTGIASRFGGGKEYAVAVPIEALIGEVQLVDP